MKASDIYLSCLSFGMRFARLGSLGGFGVGDGIFRVPLNVRGLFCCSQNTYDPVGLPWCLGAG
jgi:hypothetical protein